MAKKPGPKKAAKPKKAEAPKPEAIEPVGVGRPTIFTAELGIAVCVHIANGLSLRAIGELPGMPSKTTILEWAMDDRDNFRTMYARARELQLEAEADEIVEISDDGRNDFMERQQANGDKKVVYNRDSVDRSKLRVETRKWRLTKLAPTKYGEKIETTHKADAAFVALWQRMGGGKTKAQP